MQQNESQDHKKTGLILLNFRYILLFLEIVSTFLKLRDFLFLSSETKWLTHRNQLILQKTFLHGFLVERALILSRLFLGLAHRLRRTLPSLALASWFRGRW